MDTPNSELLASGLRAVASAGSITRKVQSQLSQLQSLTKSDKSPVTVADFAAQAIVAHYLKATGIPLVGEETSADLRGDEQSLLRGAVVSACQQQWKDATETEILDAIDYGNHDATADAYWTLDPVDGTKGFLRNQQYAISLALIENGEVKLGVLGCPNLSADFERSFDDPDPTGIIYYASRGLGCFSVPANDTASRPVAITARPVAEDARIRICESVESGHSKHDESALIVEQLGGSGTPARLDSQCKYAVVARGQADAYLRLPTRADYVEKIWDHAAGMLVAEESGRVVSDVHGKALDFSVGAGLKNNRGVICASREYHARIIEVIRKLELFAEQ